MKLFVINKEIFDEVFDNPNSTLKKSKEIHASAYKELSTSIDAYQSIPLVLMPNCDNDSIAVFEFVSKKHDVYFYNFKGIAK